jgi:hypothetical protein
MDTEIVRMLATKKQTINRLRSELDKEEQKLLASKAKFAAKVKIFEEEKSRQQQKLSKLEIDLARQRTRVEREFQNIEQRETEILERVRMLKKDLQDLSK